MKWDLAPIITRTLVAAFCIAAVLILAKGQNQNLDADNNGRGILNDSAIIRSAQEKIEALGKEYLPPQTETSSPRDSATTALLADREDAPDSSANSSDGEKVIFSDTFGEDYILDESGDIYSSANPDWSVSSGAYMLAENGIAHTIFDGLPDEDKWCKEYSASNPEDTDNGSHPQNIFRLVMLHKALDFEQQAYFRIKKYSLSKSAERRASNGLFLFNRYQDSDNIYYTGLRVDGYSTIKKKIKGQYYTMVYKDILRGKKYDRENNPNLLPLDLWIGLRSRIETLADGKVSVKLFMDMGRKGEWELIAEGADDGEQYGGKPIGQEGYGGIRTDFMDVEFDDYLMTML